MADTLATSPDPRALRRRARLVRRWLGPGPYLHAGCGAGALLALLAEQGSASGYEADPAEAEAARHAAPGCPVHTRVDALPAGVFRGIVLDGAVAGDWAPLLAEGGRVLLIGDLPLPGGLTVVREGRERRFTGTPVRLLQAAAPGMIGG